MYLFLFLAPPRSWLLYRRVSLVLVEAGPLHLWCTETFICNFCVAAQALSARASSSFAAHGLNGCHSQAPEVKLSGCSSWAEIMAACRIFRTRIEPMLTADKVDSYPMGHQRSPRMVSKVVI